MLTKQELMAIIESRNDRGKTLTLTQIDDEAYGKWTIQDAAVKYFGSWTAAREYIEKEGYFSKYEVSAKLLQMQAEGHSMKTGEFPNKLYRAITKYFGGYKQAKEELGIVVTKEVSKPARVDKDTIALEMKQVIPLVNSRTELSTKYRSLVHQVRKAYGSLNNFEKDTGIIVPVKTRKAGSRTGQGRKYTDEQLIEFLRQVRADGATSHSIRIGSDKTKIRMIHACTTRWGSFNKALEANGLTVERRKITYESGEELERTYLRERLVGITRYNVTAYSTLCNRYGSIDALNELVGFEEPVKYNPSLMSVEEVEASVNTVLASETRDLTTNVLEEHNADLAYSLREHYGSILNYFTKRDMDYFNIPRVPFEWTKENVERHLKRWIREGTPVNYVAVAQDRRGILKASLIIYGGWNKVFEAIGLDYEDYRVDTNMASVYGFKFEELVAEILSEIGVEYLREPYLNGCHPDYVIGDHWIDAKLSEWTIRAPDCETVKKYEPHCDKLSIYYLRGYGYGDGVTKISEKTTLYPIGKLIEKLPKVRREVYEDKVNALLEELTEKAS